MISSFSSVGKSTDLHYISSKQCSVDAGHNGRQKKDTCNRDHISSGAALINDYNPLLYVADELNNWKKS